jgi:hypothetical protein
MRKGDLAALVLESDVTSIGAPGSGLRPLGIEHLLADPAHLDAADYVTVVGFGTTESATFNTRKHRGLIKILSRRCSPGTAGGACAPDQEMIVRNPLRDVDSCFGDSGGPAFVALADGRFAAVAVVSRGLEPDKAGCAEGGIYTLLTTLRVRTWLATLIDPLPAAPASIAVAALTAPAPGE